MYKVGKILPVVFAFGVFAVHADGIPFDAAAPKISASVVQTTTPVAPIDQAPVVTSAPVAPVTIPAATPVPVVAPAPVNPEQSSLVNTGTDKLPDVAADKGTEKTPKANNFLTRTKETSAEYFTSAREALSTFAEKVKDAGTKNALVKDNKYAIYGVQAVKIVAAAAAVYGTYKVAKYAYSKYYKKSNTTLEVVS